MSIISTLALALLGFRPKGPEPQEKEDPARVIDELRHEIHFLLREVERWKYSSHVWQERAERAERPQVYHAPIPQSAVQQMAMMQQANQNFSVLGQQAQGIDHFFQCDCSPPGRSALFRTTNFGNVIESDYP